MTTCAYCYREMPDDYDEDAQVPSVHDDEDWAELAGLHDAECEWIITRAHRQ